MVLNKLTYFFNRMTYFLNELTSFFNELTLNYLILYIIVYF